MLFLPICDQQHKLNLNQRFFNLDTNPELLPSNPIESAFYKGAGDFLLNGYLDTGICWGGDETLKTDNHNIQYWQISNKTCQSIGGASGGGFWRFYSNDNTCELSLAGIITSESEDCKKITAMATTPFLYEEFLPCLKNSIRKSEA